MNFFYNNNNGGNNNGGGNAVQEGDDRRGEAFRKKFKFCILICLSVTILGFGFDAGLVGSMTLQSIFDFSFLIQIGIFLLFLLGACLGTASIWTYAYSREAFQKCRDYCCNNPCGCPPNPCTNYLRRNILGGCRFFCCGSRENNENNQEQNPLIPESDREKSTDEKIIEIINSNTGKSPDEVKKEIIAIIGQSVTDNKESSDEKGENKSLYNNSFK